MFGIYLSKKKSYFIIRIKSFSVCKNYQKLKSKYTFSKKLFGIAKKVLQKNMLTLIQSLWNNRPNQNSLEFVSIITNKINSPEFSISPQKVLQEFATIANDFHDFCQNEIAKVTQSDVGFQRRWNMLITSDFSAKLWNQFEDIATLCEAIMLEWTNNQLLQN